MVLRACQKVTERLTFGSFLAKSNACLLCAEFILV